MRGCGDLELLLGGEALVPHFSNGKLDTLVLGQRDVRVVALANDEYVSQPGGEHVTVGVLHLHDVSSWI